MRAYRISLYLSGKNFSAKSFVDFTGITSYIKREVGEIDRFNRMTDKGDIQIYHPDIYDIDTCRHHENWFINFLQNHSELIMNEDIEYRELEFNIYSNEGTNGVGFELSSIDLLNKLNISLMIEVTTLTKKKLSQLILNSKLK